MHSVLDQHFAIGSQKRTSNSISMRSWQHFQLPSSRNVPIESNRSYLLWHSFQDLLRSVLNEPGCCFFIHHWFCMSFSFRRILKDCWTKPRTRSNESAHLFSISSGGRNVACERDNNILKGQDLRDLLVWMLDSKGLAESPLPSQMQLLLVSALGTLQDYRRVTDLSLAYRYPTQVLTSWTQGFALRLCKTEAVQEWLSELSSWFLLFSFHHRVSGCFWLRYFLSFLICVHVIWAVMKWCWPWGLPDAPCSFFDMFCLFFLSCLSADLIHFARWSHHASMKLMKLSTEWSWWSWWSWCFMMFHAVSWCFLLFLDQRQNFGRCLTCWSHCSTCYNDSRGTLNWRMLKDGLSPVSALFPKFGWRCCGNITYIKIQ